MAKGAFGRVSRVRGFRRRPGRPGAAPGDHREADGRETLAFVARGHGQEIGEARMHQHDGAQVGVEAVGSGDVAVIGAPEELGAGVDAFRGGAALVAAFQFPRGPRDRRKPSQVQLAFNAIVHTDEALGVYGAIDCGGYVTSFMLAAQALGVATIPQAALAFHAEEVRRHFGLGDDRKVVCGISFGFPDRDHKANSYRTSRASVAETVTFHGE